MWGVSCAAVCEEAACGSAGVAGVVGRASAASVYAKTLITAAALVGVARAGVAGPSESELRLGRGGVVCPVLGWLLVVLGPPLTVWRAQAEVPPRPGRYRSPMAELR